MEVPVSRGLRAMGIAFKSQVDLGKFFKLDDPEVGIADYYIPSKKTFVQADGPRHSLKDVAARVAKQDRLIRSRGYKVVHVKPGDLAHLKAILSNI
jgi:very-short-patch-repair endonuclease